VRPLVLAVSLAVLVVLVLVWRAGGGDSVVELVGPVSGQDSIAEDAGELAVNPAVEREVVAAVEAHSGAPDVELAEESEGTETVELHLLVLDGENDMPLTGVALRDLGVGPFTYRGSDESARRDLLGETDHAGRVDLALRVTGERCLAFEFAGYAVQFLSFAEREELPERPLVVRLLRSATVVGRLAGVEAGAEVGVFPRQSGDLHAGSELSAPPINVYWVAPIEADGRFVLTGLPPRIRLKSTLLRKSRSNRALDEFNLNPGETRVVEWSIVGPGMISGLCFDEAGNGLSGVLVNVHDMRLSAVAGEHACPACYTTSDDTGYYEFRELALGEWRVMTSRQGDELISEHTGSVTLTEEREHAVVDLHFAAPWTLEGRVLTPDGSPVDDLQVLLIPESGGAYFLFTEADGSFEQSGLRPEPHFIVLRSTGSVDTAVPPPVRVEPGDTDVDVYLLAAGSVHASFIDAETGSPLEARVHIASEDEGTPVQSSRSRLRTEWELSSLRPGRYTLCAWTADGRTRVKRRIEVRAGETTEAQLALEPGSRLLFRYQGTAARVRVSCSQGGVRVAGDDLGINEEVQWSLPPGATTIVVRSLELSTGIEEWGVIETRELVLVRGEDLTVACDAPRD